jgi:hypothetical protein
VFLQGAGADQKREKTIVCAVSTEGADMAEPSAVVSSQKKKATKAAAGKRARSPESSPSPLAKKLKVVEEEAARTPAAARGRKGKQPQKMAFATPDTAATVDMAGKNTTPGKRGKKEAAAESSRLSPPGIKGKADKKKEDSGLAEEEEETSSRTKSRLEVAKPQPSHSGAARGRKSAASGQLADQSEASQIESVTFPTVLTQKATKTKKSIEVPNGQVIADSTEEPVKAQASRGKGGAKGATATPRKKGGGQTAALLEEPAAVVPAREQLAEAPLSIKKNAGKGKKASGAEPLLVDCAPAVASATSRKKGGGAMSSLNLLPQVRPTPTPKKRAAELEAAIVLVSAKKAGKVAAAPSVEPATPGPAAKKGKKQAAAEQESPALILAPDVETPLSKGGKRGKGKAAADKKGALATPVSTGTTVVMAHEDVAEPSPLSKKKGGAKSSATVASPSRTPTTDVSKGRKTPVSRVKGKGVKNAAKQEAVAVPVSVRGRRH